MDNIVGTMSVIKGPTGRFRTRGVHESLFAGGGLNGLAAFMLNLPIVRFGSHAQFSESRTSQRHRSLNVAIDQIVERRIVSDPARHRWDEREDRLCE